MWHGMSPWMFFLSGTIMPMMIGYQRITEMTELPVVTSQ